MLSVLMLCSFSIPPIAPADSLARLLAVGVDEHATSVNTVNKSIERRMRIDTILVLLL
jgi:hypothetical protein